MGGKDWGRRWVNTRKPLLGVVKSEGLDVFKERKPDAAKGGEGGRTQRRCWIGLG